MSRSALLAAVILLLGAETGHAQLSPACPEHLRALRAEALAFEHGEGVGKNVERAVRLYCEGARLGDAEAQYSLGWIYANGRGVRRDDALAAYFFRLAAEQGHGNARTMLNYTGSEAAAPSCMTAQEVGDPPEASNLPVAMAPSPDVAPIQDVLALEGALPQEQDLLAATTPRQKKVVDIVIRLAPRYGVEPRLAMAVIRAESNFDPLAVSPRNAQGLMQLIPETAERFNVRKPFDPEQNIRGGLAYLRWLLAYFKGNVTLVAAAYNAGEGTVNRFRGVPPFPETRGYVQRIRALFRADAHPYDPRITEPSPELPRIRVVMQ